MRLKLFDVSNVFLEVLEFLLKSGGLDIGSVDCVTPFLFPQESLSKAQFPFGIDNLGFEGVKRQFVSRDSFRLFGDNGFRLKIDRLFSESITFSFEDDLDELDVLDDDLHRKLCLMVALSIPKSLDGLDCSVWFPSEDVMLLEVLDDLEHLDEGE